MDRKDLAIYLRSARNKANLSKFRAAQILGYKSDGTINAIEQARAPLPIEKIHPIARAYNLNIIDLLNMIKHCDPELYNKYLTIEKDITRHKLKNFSNQIHSLTEQQIEAVQHHKPFLNQNSSLEGGQDIEFRSRTDIMKKCINFQQRLIMYIM